MRNQGRDHHPYGFSIWMAGGGIQGGQVIGVLLMISDSMPSKTDFINDLHATMLSLLGIEHTELTFLFEGRERRLTDVGGLNDLSRRLTRS